MTVTIYHNPKCSKSRQTLALLEENGINATVVEYLKTPPDAAALKTLFAQLGLSAREAMRTGETQYQEKNLSQASEEQLISAITEHPILLQRPIVVANDKAAIGRPPEAVLALFS